MNKGPKKGGDFLSMCLKTKSDEITARTEQAEKELIFKKEELVETRRAADDHLKLDIERFNDEKTNRAGEMKLKELELTNKIEAAKEETKKSTILMLLSQNKTAEEINGYLKY